MIDAKNYPAQLTGEITPPVSRWMWLVKWLLIIPHSIILYFLGIASGVLTIIAFFAILFTGKYPKSMFDFNLGVLRWNWRVSFYGYSALGTDIYPPFKLDKGGYPADFDVVYPEKLSQGLVLVKWWLLAIPHYIILYVLTSVQGILVLVNAIILLFAGSLNADLFKFVMGINRWMYRVYAYAGLMTDEYPPFTLD
jgi:hypothetical protein